MIPRRRPFHSNPLRLALAWCLLLLAAGAGLALWQHRTLVDGLERESTVLHRLVSQQADQHDAHLTALSAIAIATDEGNRQLFLEVVRTITHFYPRIDSVRLVALSASEPSLGVGPLTPALEEEIRSAAEASTGNVVLLPHPLQAHHYLMVKRSPNNDQARYALMLGIDAQKLVEGAGRFWLEPGVVLRLSLPDNQPLVGAPAMPGALQFNKTIGSASQPLLLETGLDIRWRDLFPPMLTALVLVAASLLYAAAIAAWRQRARARAAMEQARISALESRLAHASRVNTLGEMASGLMHELTQPLTAILAQAQASVRLAAQGRVDALEPVLQSTVAQARRASAILDRFRNWSRPQRAQASAFDLRETLRNVQALLTPQASSCGVRMAFSLPGDPVPVKADPVEMEQVVFNLARNAIEAVQGRAGDGHVDVSLKREHDRVVLDVSDNGPGMAPEMRDKLFTPFATTRESGMGLGLALSKRLVERMDGELDWIDAETGTRFRVTIPCPAPSGKAEP